MRRLPLTFLIAAAFATSASAGVFDDDEARRQIADLKIRMEARFDQQARANLELSGENQRLKEDISQLRGQIETLQHRLEVGDKRVQDFYLDLDSRLRKLETPAEGAAAAVSGGAAHPADAATATREYDSALDMFKVARYKESASAFSAFLDKYPDSTLAPNAQYWLGNTWYAQRNCTKAIEIQSQLTTRYPASDKAPDGWLAIATCQQELGNTKGATRTLETLIEKYPASPAADKARERVKKK